MFLGGGAVYQESRRAVLRRKCQGGPYRNELVLASSLKNGEEIGQFVDWITPHLTMPRGEFLGYSLFEDTRPSGYGWGRDDQPPQLDIEHPTLYFVGALPEHTVTVPASGSGEAVRTA